VEEKTRRRAVENSEKGLQQGLNHKERTTLGGVSPRDGPGRNFACNEVVTKGAEEEGNSKRRGSAKLYRTVRCRKT